MVDCVLKEMTCRSKEYYKGITSISITPVKIKDIKPIHRKGDKIIVRNFFGRKKTKIISEDLYDYYGDKVNKKTFLENFWAYRYNEEKDFFYYPAEVKVNRGGNGHIFKFDSNEEAKEFIETLKENCKKCGNELL